MEQVQVDTRILQANERTLLAWVRTGLTFMAFGFVVARVSVWAKIEHIDAPRSLSVGVGVMLLALGTACHVIGAVRFRATQRALLAGRPVGTSSIGPLVVASVATAGGIGIMLYLIV